VTVDEAFRILGLSPGASKEDIQSCFVELARDRHPDTPTGSETAMTELVEARDVAVASLQSNALVAVKDLVAASAGLALDRRDREQRANRAVKQLVRVQTSRHKRLRRNAAVLGGAAGGLAAIAQVFEATTAVSDTVSATATLVALAYRLAAGAAAWLFHERAQRIETQSRT
jgi:hypothetical protein